MDIFKEDIHTRFPVYEDNTDNVIGIINIKDLLLYPENEPFSIRKILREPYFTYEYKRTTDLMMEMRKLRKRGNCSRRIRLHCRSCHLRIFWRNRR